MQAMHHSNWGWHPGAEAAIVDQSAGGDASAELSGSDAAPLPNPFVSAVDSPWSVTLSHGEADMVRESLGLAPAPKQLTVHTAAAQVGSALLQQQVEASLTIVTMLGMSCILRCWKAMPAGLMLCDNISLKCMSSDALLLVSGQVAHARRTSFRGRRSLMLPSSGAASGHLTQLGEPPLTLAQSDPIAASTTSDGGGGCGADHRASHHSNGILHGHSTDGPYVAYAEGSTNRDTTALYDEFA
jgi:hypothetical protein